MTTFYTRDGITWCLYIQDYASSHHCPGITNDMSFAHVALYACFHCQSRCRGIIVSISNAVTPIIKQLGLCRQSQFTRFVMDRHISLPAYDHALGTFLLCSTDQS